MDADVAYQGRPKVERSAGVLGWLRSHIGSTWGELVDNPMPPALGLSAGSEAGSLTNWLSAVESAQIAGATGVDEALVSAMISGPLDGTLLTVDTHTRTASTPW